MTLKFSFPSLRLIFLTICFIYRLQLPLSQTGCIQIFYLSIKAKLSFFSLVFQSKVSDPTLLISQVTISPAYLAQSWSSFRLKLSLTPHFSSVSKSCFLFICELRRIRNTLNFTTARTFATSLILTKLD